MGKTQIIEELARLSPQDLAEIRARLDELAEHKLPREATRAPLVTSARLRSPRLANPSQASDFVKQVMELPNHANV